MVGLSWMTNITQSLPLVVTDKPEHRKPAPSPRPCTAETNQSPRSPHLAGRTLDTHVVRPCVSAPSQGNHRQRSCACIH